MKPAKYLFLLMGTLVLLSCENADTGDSPEQTASEQVQTREYYQLKIYTFGSDEQVQRTDTYLEEAFLPALDRQGIGPVGVFKRRASEEDTVRGTYVLIPFSSLDEFATLEEKLADDEAYVSAGNEYLNASHDQPPYLRIESVILEAFEDMPEMETPEFGTPRSERVYELRSYESPTEAYYRNKVDMFNAGGEIRLFEALEFNAVFYGEVLSGAKMPNLMYMTTFSDMESRDEHWENFVTAPEWKEMSTLPKYQNNVSHADILLLYPTAYSDY